MNTKYILAIIISFSTFTFMSASSSARGGGGSGEGFFVGFNLIPTSDSVKITLPAAAESKASGTNYDALFGYTFSNGIYLGAMMGSTSYGDTTKSTSSQTGASFGFRKNSFHLVAHYFLAATADDGQSPANKYSSGSGIGLDLGYLFPVGNFFNLGAIIQYRSVSYKKLMADTTELDTDLARTYYQPALTMAFTF